MLFTKKPKSSDCGAIVIVKKPRHGEVFFRPWWPLYQAKKTQPKLRFLAYHSIMRKYASAVRNHAEFVCLRLRLECTSPAIVAPIVRD